MNCIDCRAPATTTRVVEDLVVHLCDEHAAALDDEDRSLRRQLRAARLAAGLSQRQLAARVAEQAGGSAASWAVTIARYESDRQGRGLRGGAQDPTVRTAEAVASALGLRVVVAP